jgi:hypothetical protein
MGLVTDRWSEKREEEEEEEEEELRWLAIMRVSLIVLNQCGLKNEADR